MWGGRTWPVTLDASTRTVAVAQDEAAGAPILGPAANIRWSVAYGRNASPDALIDRGLDHKGALLLPATVAGYVRAWEARRTTSRGAIPLTLQRSNVGFLDVHVLGILDSDVAALDASEGRGSNYALGEVGPVAVAGRWLLLPGIAYGPTSQTRLLAAHGEVCTYPEVSQAECGALLDDPVGVQLRADPLVNTVEGEWPETPLEDLDLFVYGTLQPGYERWPLIADLVDIVGPATAGGALTTTFYGWPAAEFGRTGRIHGTLLRPRDAAAAVALYRTCDEAEDVGELFLRTALPVHSDEGEWWAAAYAWNPTQGDPPGFRCDDGRWEPA